MCALIAITWLHFQLQGGVRHQCSLETGPLSLMSTRNKRGNSNRMRIAEWLFENALLMKGWPTFYARGRKHRWNSFPRSHQRNYCRPVGCGRFHCQNICHTVFAIPRKTSALLWWERNRNGIHHLDKYAIIILLNHLYYVWM